MADQLSVTGIVVDRSHKDGRTNDKRWDKYGFQIAGKGGKHWYSSFSKDAWDTLEKGKCFTIYYSETDNPRGGAPFRNLEWWTEVPIEPATQEIARQAAATTVADAQNRRSVPEMRYTEAFKSSLIAHAPLPKTLDTESGKEVQGRVRAWAQWMYQELTAFATVHPPAGSDASDGSGPPATQTGDTLATYRTVRDLWLLASEKFRMRGKVVEEECAKRHHGKTLSEITEAQARAWITEMQDAELEEDKKESYHS